MDLYEDIFRRRSTLKFSLATLDHRVIEKIKGHIATLPQQEKSCDVRMHFLTDGTDFTGRLSTLGRIKAPHYVLVTGTRSESCLISAGYSAEYLVLYLTSLGIATSYMGSVMDKLTASRILGSEMIADVFIAIALGGSREIQEVYRNKDEIKRKPIGQLILEGTPTPDQLKILDAVRMAPSFMNTQCWRFGTDSDTIQLYREKLPLIRKRFFSETIYFDMGIALAHIEIAANHFGYQCEMYKSDINPGVPEYIQSIKLSQNKEDKE